MGIDIKFYICLRRIDSMKCPERFMIVQQNLRGYLYNENTQLTGDNHILIEKQEFCDCYEEECMAWDKEKKICRKMS